MSSIQKMIAAGGELPPREHTDSFWKRRRPHAYKFYDPRKNPTPKPARLDMDKVRAAVARLSHH